MVIFGYHDISGLLIAVNEQDAQTPVFIRKTLPDFVLECADRSFHFTETEKNKKTKKRFYVDTEYWQPRNEEI